MTNVGGRVLISVALSPEMDKPFKYVTHDQYDAIPTVTFPAAEHCCPTTGTKLYCLVLEAHVCKQLVQGRYLTGEQTGVEPATS